MAEVEGWYQASLVSGQSTTKLRQMVKEGSLPHRRKEGSKGGSRAYVFQESDLRALAGDDEPVLADSGRETEEVGPRKRQSVRPKLLAYLKGHPGEIVYRDEMAQALELSESQIATGMSNLIAAEPDLPVVVEARTLAWTYRPSNIVRLRKFTEVGTSSAGTVIVEDSAGKLYALKELV